MTTKVLISDEVEENLRLAESTPASFYRARTGLVYCENGCGKALEVYAKNVNYTKWSCSECSL